jgi:hypothetical protein
MLMKFTPGVDFINILMHNFYMRRSQMRKMMNDMTVIFALLVSTRVTATSKTLMKLTSGVNFINILMRRIYLRKTLWHSTSFSPTILCPTLPVHSTRGCAQFLRYTLYQCFSTWVPRNPEVPPIPFWVP